MISCDYSDVISASTASYSPSGLQFATAAGVKVTIRDSHSLDIIQVLQCIDKPDKVEFSPDSSYLFCAFLSRGAIQCFSISDPDWKCRINEGVSGFINVHWMPDSRGIITVSDFGIQVTVWSLLDSTCQIISGPKQGLGVITTNSASVQQLLAFSDCDRFLAIVHRLDLHDYIGVYSTRPFHELSKFKSRSNDIAAVYWTPNSTHIVAIDSPLTYKVVVYTASGEIVASYEAYQHALGIRSIDFFRAKSGSRPSLSSFSSDTYSSSQILSVGSYDGKVRLLSMKSWQAAFVLPLVHPRDMDIGLCEESTGPGSALITLEMPVGPDGEVGDISSVLGMGVVPGQPVGSVFDATARRAVSGSSNLGSRIYISRRANTIKSLPRIPVDPRNTKFLPPQQGVSWHGRSHCGGLLAARESSHPRCLWVWSTLEAKLQALIIQIDPILCAQWRPSVGSNSEGEGEVEGEEGGEEGEGGELEGGLKQDTSYSPATPLLAFCTGTARIYFWSPKKDSIEGDVRWSDAAPSSSASFSTSFNTSMASTVTSSTMTVAANTQKIISVLSLQWSIDGKSILLRGKDTFLVCGVPTDD